MEFSDKLQLLVDYTKSLLDKVEKSEEISVEEQEGLDAHCSLFKAVEPEVAETEVEEPTIEPEVEKEDAQKSAPIYWEDDLAAAEIDTSNLW